MGYKALRWGSKGRSCLVIPGVEASRPPVRSDLEERLQKRLGTRVHIEKGRRGGKIIIQYFSPEELDGVKKFVAGFDVMKPMEDRVDPDLVNDYLVHRFSIAGTPRECIERIEELKAAGVEHLMLTAARKVYHESVEAFATKVMPQFQK